MSSYQGACWTGKPGEECSERLFYRYNGKYLIIHSNNIHESRIKLTLSYNECCAASTRDTNDE